MVRPVRRQRSLDRTGGLKKGEFLAHRNVHRSEDETVNSIIEGTVHGLTLPNNAVELHLTKRHVHEPTGRRDVSDQLLEKMFPKLGPRDVWHFTKSKVSEAERPTG